MMSAAFRFLGISLALLHLRWNVAASKTKEARMTSCNRSAALIRDFPIFCLLLGRDVFATLAAPLAFNASITELSAAKVVNTLPGWIGEW